MRLLIFLLLYLIYRDEIYVNACLSNQGGCSVAAYRYNPECRQHFDTHNHHHHHAYHDSGGHESYNGFLGADVKAKAYSERKSSSDFAKTDNELRCLSAFNCTWQNTIEDSLDWVLGEGSVDPTKLALITGSSALPGSFDQSFLILASDPRPSHQDGQLISMAIGCQRATGILSFRYWRSRARTIGNEPELDICTRPVLERQLENCMKVTPTENHTVIASIPPIYEPFVIVLRGYNFQNEPEGGLILIDEIEYIAEVDRPESCMSKEIEGDEIEPFISESIDDVDEHVVSGDTEAESIEPVVVSEAIQQAAPTVVNSTSQELLLLSDNSERDCQSLQCLIHEIDAPCDYKRSGYGSKGEGYLVGWRITTVQKNVANKLTGIHVSPGFDNNSNFLVANFIGSRKNKVEDRFVLETPEFTISEAPTAYLSFKKYLATRGLHLAICEDGFGIRCFWNVHENSSEPFIRKWTKETVLIPKDLTTFYIVAWQNTSTVMNFGQIGLTEIGLYIDPEAKQALC